MTVLHELAEEVGADERTLRRALADGLIRGVRPGPKRLRLPVSEREWVRRSWPLVRVLRSVLRTDKNVRLSALFGSLARGEGRERSDVDLLVLLRDRDPLRLGRLELRLEQAAGRAVQLLEVEQALRSPALLCEAVGDARVLTDRDGDWPRLVRAARHAEAQLEDVDAALAALEPSLSQFEARA